MKTNIQFTSLFHLFTCITAAISTAETKKEEVKVAATPTIKSTTLLEVYDKLRSGDNRLNLEDISETNILTTNLSLQERTQLCNIGIEKASHNLLGSSSLEDKLTAANVVTVCTFSNKDNKAKLGSYGKTLHEALVSLIGISQNQDQSQEQWKTSIAASKAICASAFNSPENHQLYISSNALDALANVTMAPCSSNTPHICHLAQMWALAALTNLAESYCRTDSGYCSWLYDSHDDRLTLGQEPSSSSAMITIDSASVRRYLMQKDGFLVRLASLTCRGPVGKPHENGHYPWPSRSTVNDDGDGMFPTIVPWAAVRLWRSLALSHGVLQDDLFFNLVFECLCRMYRSADELEHSLAEEAIYRWGYAAEGDDGDCAALAFFNDGCDDLDGWMDEDGETCESYQDNRWCLEYGYEENEDGIPAKDACCACKEIDYGEDDDSYGDITETGVDEREAPLTCHQNHPNDIFHPNDNLKYPKMVKVYDV